MYYNLKNIYTTLIQYGEYFSQILIDYQHMVQQKKLIFNTVCTLKTHLEKKFSECIISVVTYCFIKNKYAAEADKMYVDTYPYNALWNTTLRHWLRRFEIMIEDKERSGKVKAQELEIKK